MGGTDREGQLWQGSRRFAPLLLRKGFQPSECWWRGKFKGCPRSPLWEVVHGKRTGWREIITWEPAGLGSLSHGPAEHLHKAAGNCRQDHTGDSVESDQQRQHHMGWLRELIWWHVIASEGDRRNTNLIGYYKSLSDLMCADKYCSLSACTREESKNIPVFLFHFCWLLCLHSIRQFLDGEILLAKEYQGGSISFSKSLGWSLFLPFVGRKPNIMWTFFAPYKKLQQSQEVLQFAVLESLL